MALRIEDPSVALSTAVRACREGSWRQGLTLLNLLGQQEEQFGQLPALYYGYLGHAIARCEGRKRVGLELCRLAVEKDPFLPENHLNLAAVYQMIGNRRATLRALNAGFAIDADHAGLRELQQTMGVRRPPVLPFFGRDNFFNVWLGQLTWWWKTRRDERQRRREEELEEERLDRL